MTDTSIKKAPRLIVARNVNAALCDALWYLHVAGVRGASRNGKVIMGAAPVLTHYARPQERVLFNVVRDANPFFHLMEALWMLNGRNDVAFPVHFAANIKNYSDDGEVLHGAYGFRWREWFGFDQLAEVLRELQRSPDSRRAVISMWSPNGDLIASEGYGGLSSKDLPCNTHLYVDRRGGVLNLSILCRSNDAIWGAYGANAVHFSILQEYLAMQLRLPVGSMWQFSHNLHVYTDKFNEEQLESMRLRCNDLYVDEHLQPRALLQHNEDAASWERDLGRFMETQASTGYYCSFFNEVASPVQRSWERYKQGDLDAALDELDECMAMDWRIACTGWVRRRIAKREEAARGAA